MFTTRPGRHLVHDVLTLRDWLFVKPSKRLLLERLLREPARTWTRTELALACEQHPKARLDRDLTPLLEAGLLQRSGMHYRLVAGHPLAARLRELLLALGTKDLPELG
jgi:hypothetical protein